MDAFIPTAEELVDQLENMRFGSLMLEGVEPDCAQLDGDRKDAIAEMAQEFCAVSRMYHNLDRIPATQAQAAEALERVIAYAEDYGRSHELGVGTIRVDNFGFHYVYRTYWKDVPCYDGGNCGTDTVACEDEMCFRYCGTEKECWSKSRDEWRKDWIRGITAAREQHAKRDDSEPVPFASVDVAVDSIRKRLGYRGSLGGENAPILPGRYRASMKMLNPFGLPGVYEVSFWIDR